MSFLLVALPRVRIIRERSKQFASSILDDIAKLIIKMLVLQAVQEAIGFVTDSVAVNQLGGSGAAQDIYGAAQVGTLHNGGIVGTDYTSMRSVPSWIFTGAPRFHSGGGIFAHDEYPAILLSGERVLNRQETSVYNSYFGMPRSGSMGHDGVHRFHDGGMLNDGFSTAGMRGDAARNRLGEANINMPITIHSSGGQSGTGGKDPLSDPEFAKALHKKMRGVVQEEILKATRYRGTLNPR